MSDTFGAADLPKGADAELQDFLMLEKQKAQVNAQVTFPTSKTHGYITSMHPRFLFQQNYNLIHIVRHKTYIHIHYGP